MKWLAVTILACASLGCKAQSDGGGRDVSVALFSAQPARVVTVAAFGPAAWWSRCRTCRHQPLTAELHMTVLREIFAGGPLTVRDEEHGQSRVANGRWHLRLEKDGHIKVALTLPSERYVAAVLMGETQPGEPRESLRAMAVVARTFALRQTSDATVSGRLSSVLCDSTACQVAKLGPVTDAVSEAVRSTAGETLWFGAQRAQVFFSGSCGGTTESAGAVWPKLAGLPYLKSMADPYCVRKDRAAWHAEVPLAALQEISAREGWRMPLPIMFAGVTQRTASERALAVVFAGAQGEQIKTSSSSLRLAIGRSLGWNLVRSDAYDLRVRDGVLVFDGRGHGHGVGLCQQGATEMARAGKSFRDILAFYFPGTAVRITQLDSGWKQSSQDSISFTSTVVPAPEVMEQVVEAWKFAKSRFPVRQQVTPNLILAPTTELFRQLTSQPGWQLASTSGDIVVLQPATVMTANRASMGSVLTHELLHVAVEANANAKAPLWLREGLVEVLAGDAVGAVPLLSVERTEGLLRSAGTRQESEAAHRAAGARTRHLVERYGMTAVRDWLVAGSAPPGD